MQMKTPTSNVPRKPLWALVASLTVLLGVAGARAGEPAPAPKAGAAKDPAAGEVTLKGTLGCGKCSFHEASACENVLKVKDGDKVETYLLADNAVSQANHEKVCGPSSPATVTGTVSAAKGKTKAKGKSKAKVDDRKILTASSITFE
jgi:Family of unknown function (DUF6370)